MKLSKKIASKITIIFLIINVVTYFYCETYLTKSIKNIEISQMKNSIGKVKNIINHDILSMSSSNLEYSRWDDTYKFMEDFNNDYIEANLRDLASLQQQNIDFIIFSDNEGKIVKDIAVQNYLGINDSSAKKKITEDIVPVIASKKQNEMSGFISTEKGIFLVSALPIVKTDGTGEPRGVLILGKAAGSNFLYRLSRDFNLSLSIETLQDIKDYNFDKEDMSVKFDDRNSISGYFLVKDVFDKPIASIRAVAPRNIHNVAVKDVHSFVCILILIECLIALAILILLHQIVTKKIAVIKGFVDEVSATGNISSDVVISGNDEISELGNKFKDLFINLEKNKEEMFDNQEKYRQFFSNLSSNFLYNKVLYDENGEPEDFLIIEANIAFTKNFNIKKEDIEGKKASSVMPWISRDIYKCKEFLKAMLSENQHKKVDSIYIEELNAWYSFVIYSIKPGYFALIFDDITEKKNKDEMIIKLAYYDVLTGLPNRKNIMECISKEFDNGEKFSILFMDLDNFKEVNDKFGHRAGDYVLSSASERLKSLIDDNVVIGRLGGDEFLILKRHSNDIEEAKKLAQDIEDILSKPFTYYNSEISIGASIGISIYPDDGSDITKIISNADKAMYNIKREGGFGYSVYKR